MALKTKERAVDTLKSIAKVLQGIYNKDIRIEILASRHGRVRVNITEKDYGGGNI